MGSIKPVRYARTEFNNIGGVDYQLSFGITTRSILVVARYSSNSAPQVLCYERVGDLSTLVEYEEISVIINQTSSGNMRAHMLWGAIQNRYKDLRDRTRNA